MPDKAINLDRLKDYDNALKDVLNVWRKGKVYSLGAIVKYKGHVLECITAGTSGTITLDFTNKDIGDTITDGTVVWTLIEENSSKGLDFYTVGEDYSVGDIVIYGGNIYQCVTAHTATSTFDTTKWSEVSASENGISEWQTSIDYEVDDIVMYNYCLYTCYIAHTSTSTFDDTKFVQLTYRLEENSNLIEGIFGEEVL